MSLNYCKVNLDQMSGEKTLRTAGQWRKLSWEVMEFLLLNIINERLDIQLYMALVRKRKPFIFSGTRWPLKSFPTILLYYFGH